MLVAGAGAFDAAQRNTERDLEILDIARVDGLELREPKALVVAMVQQPVLRLLAGRSERALLRHVGCAHWRECACHQQQCSD